jgi:hypothetical protein
MTALAWGVLGLLGMFLFAALGDLVSEEIRGWLDLVPRAILRLAAVQLDPDVRESIYEGEWLPDLIYELRGAESRPITRVVRGTKFSIGLLISARRIGRYRAGWPGPIGRIGRSNLGYFWLISSYRRAKGPRVQLSALVDSVSARLGLTPDTLLSDPRFINWLEACTLGHFCPRAKPGAVQPLTALKHPARNKVDHHPGQTCVVKTHN